MTITLNSLIQRVPQQSSSVLGTETIVLHYNAGAYFELDELGSFIWARIDPQPTQVTTIKQAILAEYEVEPTVCEQELIDFLTQLQHASLINTVTQG